MNQTTGRNRISYFWVENDSSIKDEDAGNRNAQEAQKIAREDERSNNLNKALQLLAVLGTMALVLFKACGK